MMVLSGGVVIAFALFLIGLAMAAFARPERLRAFLGAFASSARVHYAEQAARFVVGSALVHFSPAMWPAPIFRGFGWVIVITTLGLLLLPWRWHRAFAQITVPPALRRIRLFGFCAAALGTLLLAGVVVGSESVVQSGLLAGTTAGVNAVVPCVATPLPCAKPSHAPRSLASS